MNNQNNRNTEPCGGRPRHPQNFRGKRPRHRADGLRASSVGRNGAWNIHQESSGTSKDGGDQNPHRQRRNNNSGFSKHGSMQNLSTLHNPKFSDKHHKEKSMGFMFIKDLLEKDNDTENLMMTLRRNFNGFVMTLNKDDLTDDFIVIIIQLLDRIICEATFHEVQAKLLRAAFDNSFRKKLLNYINQLYLQDKKERERNKYFWRNTDKFWYSISRVSLFILDSSPSYACEVLPKLVKSVTVAIPNIEENMSIHVSDEIKDSFKEINEKLNLLVAEYEIKKKEETRVERDDQEQVPPNDFRDINIYPNSQELINPHFNFLRKNVIKGPYKSTFDYLDIQFRLLREDFVAPLREGICSYLAAKHLPDKEKKRLQNIRIYNAVHFLNPECVNNQNCYRVSFKLPGKKISFKYENSRRFMFGALMCFTQDNFKTIIFGKIVDRKLELLQSGSVIVGFDSDQEIDIDYKNPYMMIECSVYFEPYFHVLSVLKKFDFNSFPMEKYIVKVDNTPQYPKYLLPTTSYSVDDMTFMPLNWPVNHKFFNLNESQNEAFKAALTQEFAVIQGPPGTGKTFLGLKIARTLLKNKAAWYKRTPMLVICYTNHALDQFLEGLIGVTEGRILRVGGQSKNEKLEQFNIRKKQRREDRAVVEARWELRDSLTELKRISGNIAEIDKFDSIVDFACFKSIAPDISWLTTTNHSDQLSWLLFRRVTQRSSPDDLQQMIDAVNLQRISDDSDIEDDDIMQNDDEFDSDIFRDIGYKKFSTVTDLKELDYHRNNFEKQLAYIQQDPNLPELEKFERIDETNAELDECNYKINVLQDMLKRGKMQMYPIIENFKKYAYDMNRLTFETRWNLYFSLLSKYKEYLQTRLIQLNFRFQRLYREYNELREIEDVNVMRDVLVVGMTTTGAARLRSSLQALRSPIVIVEEAAEVLEAHIVTSLTPHCQHLILIGDHQQLKPSTAHFKIETNFNLGVSLFERMVHNDIQCYMLDVQHRMRPEISALIAPRIYPNLKNHDSVFGRPQIAGVEKPVYFIDHREPEDKCEDESKKNSHEASFLIGLARHLILNGYKPEDITILAAYLGQLYEMQREKKKNKLLLQDVRIAVLDNYQGEECEIILLSLVRSNNEQKIGFLDIENRVCVALSRARTGFYITGNMEHLVKNNKTNIWPCVKKTLEDAAMIGPYLTMKCQIHPYNLTQVKCGDDFSEISEGGCKEHCNRMLVCGHKCTSLCHIMNRDHTQFKCKEKCTKNLCETNENHVCKKMCFEECGPCSYTVDRTLDCGHTVSMECFKDPALYECNILIETKLPCGHTADKPCYKEPAEFSCPYPCDTKVEPCGHACIRKCHIYDDPDHLKYKCRKPCEKYGIGCTEQTEDHKCRKHCYEPCSKCEIPVKRVRSCTHIDVVPCSSNIEDVECMKPCKKMLPCGHKCKSNCNEPCGTCKEKVDKFIPECNHKIKIECSEVPSRKLCNKKCPLKLRCGHSCLEKCSNPCTQQCKEMVECEIRSPCGHVVTRIECYLKPDVFEDDPRLLQYCTSPCTALLLCEHLCLGTCGECYQGRFHKKCAEKCGALQICSHECTTPCRKACKPCMQQCLYRCSHSQCKRKCGEPCTPCSERCNRICPHQKCKNLCGAICSVNPCEEPCKKTLPRCGHPCTGFCSERCPKICFECDKDKVEEIFMTFATEDEENARLVQLVDCNHIVENSGMNRYLAQDDEEIKMKVCPLCKTPIIKTKRYSDFVKKSLGHIRQVQVKMKLYESEAEKTIKRNRLLLKIGSLEAKLPPFLKDVISISIIKERLQANVQGRRQTLSSMDLSSIESKYQILENIHDILAKFSFSGSDEWLENVRFICKSMLTTVDEMRDQEAADITSELKRLSCLAELVYMREQCNGPDVTAEIRCLYDQCKNKLNDFRKFTEEINKEVVDLIKKLQKLLPKQPSTTISQAEIKQIVSAMGTAQGHWYRCPNGHNYYIGDCGGAMQKSKCNECGSAIGGESHRLLSDNAHSNIDGSAHAAWSEQANMRNYDFEAQRNAHDRLNAFGIRRNPFGIRRNAFGIRRLD